MIDHLLPDGPLPNDWWAVLAAVLVLAGVLPFVACVWP